MANPMAQAAIGGQLLKVAEKMEQEIDAEMNRLDKLDEDGLEAIRRQRLEQIKKLSDQKDKWQMAGHGEYTQLADEKAFFEACKKSERLVCHWFLGSNMRCEIVDKHMRLLARKHPETRFVSAQADKFPFLTGRLNIRVIPTIALVKNEVTIDYIRGFDDLGGVDDFTTEQLEWRIAQNGLINYDGDLSSFPESGAAKTKAAKGKSILGFPGKKKNIRAKDSDSDSDD